MLLSIQLLLLIAGMFLDAISIYFIFLPLLIPIAMHFNWDLVWFGVIITMNMALGQFHPPLGVNLMVTCRMAGVSMESTVPWVLWMVAAMAGLVLAEAEACEQLRTTTAPARLGMRNTLPTGKCCTSYLRPGTYKLCTRS